MSLAWSGNGEKAEEAGIQELKDEGEDLGGEQGGGCVDPNLWVLASQFLKLDFICNAMEHCKVRKDRVILILLKDCCDF